MKTKYVFGCIFIVIALIAHSIVFAEETTCEKEKLNLNIATLDELKALPDMTPETAQAIIENRPYEKIEDLLKVNGMSEELLAKFQDKIEVKKVNINTAKISALKLLPEVTPEMAKAIIEGRPYKIVEELLKVKGIGEEQLAKLEGFIEAKPREEGEDEGDKGWRSRQQNFPPPATGNP